MRKVFANVQRVGVRLTLRRPRADRRRCRADARHTGQGHHPSRRACGARRPALPDQNRSQFDVFVVGSHPREQLLPPGSPVALASPGTTAPLAVLLVGGRVSGVWERKSKGKRLVIRVDAYRSLNRRQKAWIEAKAARIAEVLGRDCELEFGKVELRRHL